MKRQILTIRIVWSGLVFLTSPIVHGFETTAPPNLVRDVPGAIAVDSSFSGYGTAVLSDGKWIAKGQETTQDYGSRDRLGNGGNTWVSADTETEHWIRVDWPQPQTLNEVEIWWSLSEWQPRAFRIETLRDGRWSPAAGGAGWLAATDRQSIVALPNVETQSLRIVQPAGGGGSRNLMAAQEVSVFFRPDGPHTRSGARQISAAEVRRLKRRELEPNLARLECSGAATAIAWLTDGAEIETAGLADGDCGRAVAVDPKAEALGVRWPIAHVADGLTIHFSAAAPEPTAVTVEVHDGRKWVAIRSVSLGNEQKPNERQRVYAFEPVATTAIRIRSAGAQPLPAVTEIEVSRYLPPRKDVWPDRLVGKNLRAEMLAAGREPSFESLSLWALPMTPVRALLGVKDDTREIGVAWDGAVIGRDTLQFSFGTDRDKLADCRDTVRRSLIDGWRPGTIVEGRIGPLAVRQTALVALAGKEPSQPAVFVRVEVTNLSPESVASSLQAEIAGREGNVQFREAALVRGNGTVLLAPTASRADNDGESLRVDLALEPNERTVADFVFPLSPAVAGAATQSFRITTFDDALAWFRSYWDQMLGPAAKIEVSEPRINRMFKAVLAQLFINGDGDIMPYGSSPSVYEGKLYGIEESYAMFALAQSGFAADAQRYMDGTYLTPDFLKKVDVYKTYPERHQQYRNGLQPHFAAELYRLTRDAAWIRKHVPLLKKCAEWTIAQRRRTMQGENGAKPLHWGLLPKWSYGGDISEVQCYALYANYCCWRGLVDTAWLLAEMGDEETARRYAEEARQYRADIDRAVEGNYRADQKPPFLPLALYATRPDEQMDYYQLFAGCLLNLHPFGNGSEHLRWITDFLEEDNRMFCLLPRFRRDVGAGGLDALYGIGYLQTKLRQDAVEEFLLGFYAFLAFNMDHETFISRETNLLYASDLHVRSSYRVPEMSDPIPCSSAVAVQWLRQMLLSEELAGAGEYSGNLLLLSGVPRAWLGDGQCIRVRDAPTHFGPVSFEVRSAAGSGRIEATVQPPVRNACRAVKLRLRHPESRPIRSVTVDGQPWSGVDGAGEWISLPPRAELLQIVVSY